MKKLLLILALLPILAFGRGRLQDADFKSESELTAAGATKAQLLNDSKIYVTGNGINDTMANAVTNGLLGGVPAWSSGSTYQIGRVVYYTDNNIYRCLTANSDSTFDFTKWQLMGPVNTASPLSVNFLANHSFEFAATGWTATGLTAVQTSYTNSISGDKYYATLTSTSASQTLCSSLVTIPDNAGAGGMIDFSYTASGTKFLVYVKDGSGNKLTSPQTLLDQTSWTKLSSIAYAHASQEQVCFESNGAGTLKIDNVYMGTNKGIIPVENFNKTYDTTQVTVTGFSSIYFARFYPYVTVDKATNLPRWRMAFNVMGTVASWTTNTSKSFAFSGVTFSGTSGNGQAVSVSPEGLEVGTRGFAQIASNIVLVSNTSGGTFSGVDISGDVELTGKPTWADDISINNAQTPDANNWFIDANIGGANPLLSISPITSYTEITDAGLDLVKQSFSSDVQIACASGTDSTGLTCSSNESVGITFTNPNAGLYESCASFGAYWSTTDVATVFQLIETTPLSSSIVSEGNSRIEGYVTSANVGFPFQVCGIFKFNDSKRRTIRLAYEKLSGGSSPQIFADRNSSLGQRDIHFTVRPLIGSASRAYLTGDQVTTHGQNNSEFFSFTYGTGNSITVCSASPCSYVDQIGDRVSSVVRGATGSYTPNFNKTFSKLKCEVQSSDETRNTVAWGNTSSNGSISCSNCSSLTFNTGVLGSAQYDTHGTVMCHGY